MEDSTRRWLHPILGALTHDDFEEVAHLTLHSSTPVNEEDDRFMEVVSSIRDATRDTEPLAFPTNPGGAIDWIRFGQLGIERLRWNDSYPWEPPPD